LSYISRSTLIRMRLEARSIGPPQSFLPEFSHGMSLIRLYTRVLELLGKEAGLGWILAGANLALAAAQFAEPGIFGRIVDVLSGKAAGASAWPLLAAWVAFGLFTIAIGAIVALHADRLAHRQRQAVLTSYFEHIPAIAADLPLRHPFGAADEGDAERHRRAVAALARLLPRAFRRDHVGRGAAAAVALHQLAAGGSSCSCCAWCSRC